MTEEKTLLGLEGLLDLGQIQAAEGGLLQEGAMYQKELFAALAELVASGADLASPQMAAWRAALPEELSEMLGLFAAHLEGQALTLPPEAWLHYQAGLAALMGRASETTIAAYAPCLLAIEPMHVGRLLGVTQSLVIARHYEIAFSILSRVPQEELDPLPKLTAQFWYQTGICLYEAESPAAHECFERAKAGGIELPQLEAYLAWSERWQENAAQEEEGAQA